MNILRRLLKENKALLMISVIAAAVIFFSRCVSGHAETADPRGEAYAGAQSCLRCHGAIAGTYQHTAHFRTSRDVKDLPADWLPARRFSFNDSVEVSIERRDSGIYQSEYLHGKEILSKPFHIGIGSGDDAVSFGYWQGKKIYQLPLTYFEAIHGWANSPGFPSAEPFFNRPVVARCFECHSSYIAEDAEPSEGLATTGNLDKRSLIYGIDCERCHGPAANHVGFHTANPSVKEAKYMVRWASLTRERKLDACAVCHSGNDQDLQQPAFWFRPGDTLANYYFPFGGSSAEPDVHGKQMQLLAASRCFQSSKLECTSCHAPHQPASGNLALQSASCTGCHKKDGHLDCPLAVTIGPSIESNCIDCHMPYLASRKINIQTGGSQLTQSYLLRTHRIAIYPEETEKVMKKLKSVMDGKGG